MQVLDTVSAASISYFPRLQSLLVEGLAAATIGTLVDEKDGLVDCKGRVLLLLNRGHVSSSTVAKALEAKVGDPQARQKLGLRNIINAVECHGSVAVFRKCVKKNILETSTMPYVWRTMDFRLEPSTEGLRERFDQKRELAGRLGHLSGGWSNTLFQDTHQHLTALIDNLNNDLRPRETPKLALWIIEDRHRTLLQMQSTLSLPFERASAAYDQLQTDWFFDISTQNATAVKYERYGLANLRALEIRFLDVLGLGQSPIELLLSSSGMAADPILQHYLLQGLNANSVLVIPPYILSRSDGTTASTTPH